ncbi:MAG: prepilin-type N-terminal cleavage/methylation domain-containing protein [Turicibacter sp.]|nr:prepilin-type N-terminal cleavage/methylation domain-containing protein [Turicibacter sp.]
MKKSLRRKGFTLIELIIVIAIIAILAAIAVPAFGNIISKSKQTAYYATADRLMKTMNTYVTMYDEEIRKLGGYNVQVVGYRDGDSYRWQVYTGTPHYNADLTFDAVMGSVGMPKAYGTLVYDSTNPSKQLLPESFGDYLDSIVDPFSGKPFEIISITYDMEFKPGGVNTDTVLGGYINLYTRGTDAKYSKQVDNQDNSSYVGGALPGEPADPNFPF